MTVDGLLIVRAAFRAGWRIFTGWTIPGTATTPAGFFMAMLFISMVIRNLGRIFNISIGVDQSTSSNGKGGKGT